MKKWSQIVMLASAILIVVLLAVNADHLQNTPNGHAIDQLRTDLLNRAKNDFSAVNDRVRSDYGFSFSEPKRSSVSCYNSRDSMDNKNDDTCLIASQSKPVVVDDAFTSKWHKTSPGFETWLLQNGWHKVWDEKQPIAEILDNPQNKASVATGVNYERKSDGISCIITFMWVQPHEPNQLTSTEQCNGSIK